MKRLIVLVLAVGFCVMLFAPPLAAKDHDPAKPLPWMDTGARPNGDEGGWNDITSIGEGQHASLVYDFKLHISKYLLVYFIPKELEHKDTREKHGFTDNRIIDRSRTASSE